MKYLITENKFEKVLFSWLDNNYGELELYDDYGSHQYYFHNNKILFDRLLVNNQYIVSEKLWDMLRTFFSLTYDQTSDILKKWISDVTGKEVSRVVRFGTPYKRRWNSINNLF